MLHRGQGIIVHLNPADVAFCRQAQDQNALELFSNIKIEPDPNVRAGRLRSDYASGPRRIFHGNAPLAYCRGACARTIKMKTLLSENLIDFDKLHKALHRVDLLSLPGLGSAAFRSYRRIIRPQSRHRRNLRHSHKQMAAAFSPRSSAFATEILFLLPLEHFEGIGPGDRVTARSTPRYISLGPSILGRVLDGLGRPIDGKGPLVGNDKRPLDSHSPPPLSREKITQPLSLGIRAIDGMLTCGKGQRVGIFAGSGVGKSVLLGEMASASQAQINVRGTGRRTRQRGTAFS